MDCSECPMAMRIANLEDDSKRNQTTHKEFFNRFEAIVAWRAQTEEKYAQIIQNMAEIKSDVKETKTAVQNINEKPAKRWENIVTSALTGFVALLIGYCAAKLGFIA